jgi:hypothetical protein
MNIEYRMSKEGILPIFMDSKDRAQRFHPSKFDTAELVAGCGWIFCCSAVRFSALLWFRVQDSGYVNRETELLKSVICFLSSDICLLTSVL